MIHMIVNGVVYNSQDNQFLSKVEASLGCNRAFWAFWIGWLGCHNPLFPSTPDKDPGFDETQPQALLLCSVLLSVLPQCFDRAFLQLDPLPVSKWSRYLLVWNNYLTYEECKKIWTEGNPLPMATSSKSLTITLPSYTVWSMKCFLLKT